MSLPIVAVASDHGGFDLKTILAVELNRLGYPLLDLGTDSTESVDYPDYAQRMAAALHEKQATFGVLLCGTGIGISIAANRFPWIRAALIHDALGARLSRQHNDANVICMGGRTIGPDLAKDCLQIFLTTVFEGGRHARRIAKMSPADEMSV
ncbi:MAG TPA: ribose 5-phosphate isomerase B [Magnetospirillaceae bacterium]|jgi:ribose 5-phosphate isomerase B